MHWRRKSFSLCSNVGNASYAHSRLQDGDFMELPPRWTFIPRDPRGLPTKPMVLPLDAFG